MKFLFIIISLVSLSLKAQDYKFGEVSKAELEQKFHPLDSTAPAAVLFEKGYMFMLSGSDLEVEKRLKIYNSNGYKYATIELPYYSEDSYIKKIKASTYNLEGDKIVKHDVEKSDIITEKLSDNYEQVKFTFPNLKPGSVIEFSYKKYNVYNTPTWAFQDEIPVNTSLYELVIPKSMGFKERVKGYQYIERQIETTNRYKKYIYQTRDIPKLEEEPFVNNKENYTTSIGHEFSYYSNRSFNVNFQLSNNWKQVCKVLQDSKYFGEQLDDTKYFEDDLDILLKNVNTDTEKIQSIFNHVKSRVKWNSYVGISCSKKLKKIYKEEVGNVADINLMLTAMLRHVGFQAHPVLVSTIKHGIPTTSPSFDDYNYIISAIELKNNKYILLDATDPFSAPNILPTRCLNWYGRLVRPNTTSKLINLNPKQLSQDNFIMNIKILEDGSLTGQMRRQYTNQYAYKYRTEYSAVNNEDYINGIENELGIVINDNSIQNIKDLSKPVVETLVFEKQNATDVINNNIYMSPLLFLAQKENPFKQDQKERQMPINFTFPKSKRYIINIEVPQGYKIDYMPESKSFGLPDNKTFYSFNIKKTQTGDLQIMVNQKINQAILSETYYQHLKSYYDEIVIKETDKIVLSKT